MTKEKFKIKEIYSEDIKRITLEYDGELYYITLYYDGTAKIIDTTIETEDGTIFEDEEIYEEILQFLENKGEL